MSAFSPPLIENINKNVKHFTHLAAHSHIIKIGLFLWQFRLIFKWIEISYCHFEVNKCSARNHNDLISINLGIVHLFELNAFVNLNENQGKGFLNALIDIDD